ncbi:glycine oxidase ThiO [Rossellomorea aquimaris]|uniref:glycine oxidase ThiO n=1 Tax=Rossellomorea aquimaris TaxID=189382 RepID=UPI001CD31492|nr:glycine oxidase ThiO [Rossellomorea aquimaris]MCA1053872.1 glycine oxidase ThiO [Rossellomorea aquimaris]
MRRHYDVIIVGGGVIGSSIAYQLANRTKRVLLLEKDSIGDKASSAAAGMLGVHTELGNEIGLYKLAAKSRDMFPSLSEELREISGIDIEFNQNGMLKLAFSEGELKALQSVLTFSEDVEWLTEADVARLEPCLEKEHRGALHAYKDGNVSARNFTLSLAKAAMCLGVEMIEFSKVTNILYEGDACIGIKTEHETFYSDETIIACGAWSSELLSAAGIHLDGHPVKGECFSVVFDHPLIERTIFTEGCYLVPKPGNRLLVGATEHPYTYDTSVTLKGMNSLMNEALTLFPQLSDAKWEKAWAGVRPKTDDVYPQMGRVHGWRGLSVATGHYRNGILLAPITGMMMADLMDGKDIPQSLKPERKQKGVWINESKA